MPRIIFKYLWDNLEAGKDVKAFVKNLRKDGGFYWVLAFVRVAKNPDGSFRNYVSTRRGASKSEYNSGIQSKTCQINGNIVQRHAACCGG